MFWHAEWHGCDFCDLNNVVKYNDFFSFFFSYFPRDTEMDAKVLQGEDKLKMFIILLAYLVRLFFGFCYFFSQDKCWKKRILDTGMVSLVLNITADTKSLKQVYADNCICVLSILKLIWSTDLYNFLLLPTSN